MLSDISRRELRSSYLIGVPWRRERGMMPPITSSLSSQNAYTTKNIDAAVVVGNSSAMKTIVSLLGCLVLLQYAFIANANCLSALTTARSRNLHSALRKVP